MPTVDANARLWLFRGPWPWLLGAGCAVLVLLMVTCGGVVVWWLLPDGPPAATKDVSTLYTEYSDRATADRKYLGKVIEFQHVHTNSLREDRFGNLAWEGRIKGPRPRARVFERASDFQREMQEAALNAEYIPAAIFHTRWGQGGKITGKQTVTIRGRCKGIVRDDSGWPEYIVVIEDCRVIPEK
jgi:hypothetical protein